MELVAAHDRAESRIRSLMATINAATAALVEVIGEVVERDLWTHAAGIRSAEHWVTWQCGVSPGRAAGLVQIARRRAELPASSAVFERGQLAEESMALIARRVPAGHDGDVAEHAERMLHTQLARLVRACPARPAPPQEERPASVTFGTVADRWVLRANLPLDDGAVVERALVAARAQVFAERHSDAANGSPLSVSWADGLARVGELALQAAAGDTTRRPADRFQVLVHLDASRRNARLHLGEVLPDALRRHLTCDADLRAAVKANGALVALSPRLRTVDDRLRAIVEQRDGGCRMPGCTQRRWLHVHHIVHWEDGGPTCTTNLCALCPRHHRLHHQGAFDIRGDADRLDGLEFVDRHGRSIGARGTSPPIDPLPPPVRPYRHPSGERIDWRAWAFSSRGARGPARDAASPCPP